MQSDAITGVQSVPQSLAAILGERRDRTKLGLSKFTAEAAEQAAEHPEKIKMAGKVRDIAAVHSILWPEPEKQEILNIALLTGQIQVLDDPDYVKP
jgi:Fe-S cluster assembly ATPase SufC